MTPALPRAPSLHRAAAVLAAADVAWLLHDKAALRRVVEIAEATTAAPLARPAPGRRGARGC